MGRDLYFCMIDFGRWEREDFEIYFAEHATLRHVGGYGDYLDEVSQNQNLKSFLGDISGTVLELGGALGHRAYVALHNTKDISRWDILELYNSTRKIEDPRLHYRFGDVRQFIHYLPNYDNIFTCRFLECIPEEDLPILIKTMNRLADKQFHIITLYKDGTPHYNAQTLKWWGEQGLQGKIISYQHYLRGDFDERDICMA